MKGECLCGEVKFEIEAELQNLYQCHCSLCRKVTGSSANAATFVHQSHFCWLSGIEKIRSYQKETGYRADFCSSCGSPVPNALKDSDLMWVPAGLLDGYIPSEIAVHLHLASSAPWDRNTPNCKMFQDSPQTLDSLWQALQRKP